MYKPSEDGITHINIYSKGTTVLGCWLSNFTRYRIETEDGLFESIEGYWYWLGCKDPRLRSAYGYEAKKLGRELGAADWLPGEEFKRKIKKALRTKILSSKTYSDRLRESTLPLTHYYVYGDKQIFVPEADWIIEEIEAIRRELKNDRVPKRRFIQR